MMRWGFPGCRTKTQNQERFTQAQVARILLPRYMPFSAVVFHQRERRSETDNTRACGEEAACINKRFANKIHPSVRMHACIQAFRHLQHLHLSSTYIHTHARTYIHTYHTTHALCTHVVATFASIQQDSPWVSACARTCGCVCVCVSVCVGHPDSKLRVGSKQGFDLLSHGGQCIPGSHCCPCMVV